MALPNSAISFSIKPGTKIAKVTKDDATGVTHDAAITIKIGTINFDDSYFQAEHRGDGKILDSYTEFDKVTGNFELSEQDFAALAMLTGHTVSTTGTGDTEVKSIDYNANNFPNYFALGFSPKYCPDASVKSLIFFLHKCKITGIGGGGGDRAYNKRTVNFEAIPRIYDSLYKSEKAYATETAVSFASLSPST